MHITEVSATNLKGCTFTHQLTPCTILAGKNQSGKTAILDAIRFVISGRNPALDKTPTGTFELSSGSRMEAQILFLDTITTETVYARKAVLIDGSVKITPPKPYVDLESPLLDPDAYWGLTDREQVDHIAEQAKLPENISAAGIIARLERISFGEDHAEEVEWAKWAAVKLVKDCFDGASKSELQKRLQLTVQAISDEFKTANSSATQWEKASQGFAELRLREDECSADTLTDLRAESERIGGLTAKANQRVGELLNKTDTSAVKEAARALDYTVRDMSRAQQVLDKSIKDVEEIDSMECCKFCQGKAKGWKNKILVPLLNAKTDAAEELNRCESANKEAKSTFEKAVNMAVEAKAECAEELARTTKELEDYQDALNLNNAKLQSAHRLQQDLQRAAQSETEWTKAKTSRDVLKRIKKELLAIKAELVTAAFEPLLTTANRIMASVLGFDLAYDPDKGIGYWSPTGFVSHRTMSGTEKALTYIAIGAALASGSQLRLAMVDELYRLSPENQHQAMIALLDAVEEDLLDQVLVVMPMDSQADLIGIPIDCSVVWTGSEVAA